MKRISVLFTAFAALAVVCSCEKKETDRDTFYFKSEIPITQIIEPQLYDVVDTLTLDKSAHTGSFTAFKPEIIGAIYGSGYAFEIYDEEDNIVLPPKGTQSANQSYRSFVTRNLCSYEWHITVHYPDATSSICPPEDVAHYMSSSVTDYQQHINVDPLLAVYTSSEFWYDNDAAAKDKMKRFGFCHTADLNGKAGVSTDYCRAYFGGDPKYLDSRYVTFNNHPDYGADIWRSQFSGKAITGLCVYTGFEDARETILDEEGKTWHLVPSCAGSHDMNNNAGGDYIYLYYTTDYTGRKLTMVNPRLSEYILGGGNSAYLEAILGQPQTIYSAEIGSWNVLSADMVNAIANQIAAETGKPELANTVKTHFDFVPFAGCESERRRSDAHCPAEFNRNTGGWNIFIGYSYITEDDPEWDQI